MVVGVLVDFEDLGFDWVFEVVVVGSVEEAVVADSLCYSSN